MKKAVIGVLIAAGVGAVAVGQTIAAGSGGTHTHAHSDKVIVAASNGKVTICHIPPGNPANRHTISVGQAAVNAHLAHGDTLGACGGGFIPPDLTPPPS